MAKLTIEEMREIAEKRGGKCLSNTYVNAETKLLWECTEGHKWEATTCSVKYSFTWCPYCAGSIKLTIEEMHDIAVERGGKCLSNTYVNTGTKLLWECVKGHKWEEKPSSIKSGKWCIECSNI